MVTLIGRIEPKRNCLRCNRQAILLCVKLIFGPDEENEFYEAQDELSERFGSWIQRNYGAENDDAVGHARLALEWKYNYGDGDLATWTLPNLDEFLLEWFPRKVSMPAEFAKTVPPSMGLLCTFLAANSLLSGESSSLKSIDAHLRQVQAPFNRAFLDTSRHGMTKSLFSSMSGKGVDVDLDDPASINNVMNQFNSLPFEERSRILGLGSPFGSAMGSALQNIPNASAPGGSFEFSGAPQMEFWYDLIDGMELPPAPLISKHRLNELALQSPILTQFDQITSFCERPRKLTKTNRLSLADAVTLATSLGTDSSYMSMAKVRSAGDLSQLSFRLDWAREAGAIRVTKGALHATTSWQKKTPFQRVQHCVDALLETGPLALSEQGRWFHLRVREFLDAGLPAVLCVLGVLGGSTIPVVDLLDTIHDIMDEGLRRPNHTSSNLWQSHIQAAFLELMAILELAGLVECVRLETDGSHSHPMAGLAPDTEPKTVRVAISSLTKSPTPNPGATGLPPQSIGVHELDVSVLLRLTELGRVCAVPYLAKRGFETPVVGLLAKGPIKALFDNVGSWHPLRLEAEFGTWIEANGLLRGQEEMVALANTSMDIQVRIAMICLCETQGEHAEQLIRSLVPTKAAGHAVGWLITHDLEEATEQTVQQAMVAGFEQLSLYCNGEPDEDEEVLAMLQVVFAQMPPEEFFRILWHVPEAWAGDVLATIGRIYPEKAVAKAARKAVIQQQTYMATNRNK
jgi:hypothetical protein